MGLFDVYCGGRKTLPIRFAGFVEVDGAKLLRCTMIAPIDDFGCCFGKLDSSDAVRYKNTMSKNNILEEIKRTAEANGGIPLGKQRFFQETGIKESDWSGKFWARWGDAVKDAGYSPNKMQDAFLDESLLEAYASLVKKLGRVPTSPELRLAAGSDSDFPSHNTFSRFGSKHQLLEKLLAFCQSNENYSDLVSFLDKLPKKKYPPENEIELTKIENGYVYLLHFGGEEYKIGCSKNVERRFREIKTQMPYDGTIIHAIETGDPEGIEAYWHQFFKDKRLKGEWFKLTVGDIKYFRQRKLM